MSGSVDKKILIQSTILILLALSFVSGSVPRRFKKEKLRVQPTLESVLESLHKLMIFFSERYDKLNVDGLFGIRAVEGEMLRTLSLAKSGVYTEVRDNDDIRNIIEDILDIAKETAEKALPEVRKKDETYYQNFLPVIGKPWRLYEVLPQKIIKMKENELPSVEDSKEGDGTEIFDEKQSDKCMMTLLGNNGGEKCDVHTCWDIMTKPATKLYYTTHQILWFQLGMAAGCQQKFEEKVPSVGGIEKVLRSLCGNVIFQMDAVFQDGTVQYPYQDIFMEQGMVCGSSGFMDAVNITWLEGVMRWQHDKIGCFREIDVSGMDFNYDDYHKWMHNKKNEWRSRNLLEDVEMGDHCSAHKSAVAAGYLAVHLRLFLDPEYRKHQLWPVLYGKDYDADAFNLKLKYIALGILIACCLLIFIGPRKRNQLLRWLVSCCKR